MPFCSECGAQKRRVNADKVCSTCAGKASPTAPADDETDERTRFDIQDEAFWTKMNGMFDLKLNGLENKINENIKTEVKKVTDPLKTKLDKLEKENKTLKAEMATIRATQKEEKSRTDKIVKVLKEQQTTLGRSDKNERFKRLILSGVPEDDDIMISNKNCVTEHEKVLEIIKSLQVGNVNLVGHRRVGNKDQGTGNRPRYILLEFMSSSDRNKVKKASAKLKDNDSTKNFFLKADKTKKERDEYTRLYKVKEQLEKDEPEKVIEISYGKLMVDGVAVDKVETENDFLL